MKNLAITDVQVFVCVNHNQVGEDEYDTSLGWSANFAINDAWMLQYDPTDGFSIPSSNESSWNDNDNPGAQDNAVENFVADDVASFLEIPTDLKTIENEYGVDLYGDDAAKKMYNEIINND